MFNKVALERAARLYAKKHNRKREAPLYAHTVSGDRQTLEAWLEEIKSEGYNDEGTPEQYLEDLVDGGYLVEVDA